jgi:hypothetical protein
MSGGNHALGMDYRGRAEKAEARVEALEQILAQMMAQGAIQPGWHNTWLAYINVVAKPDLTRLNLSPDEFAVLNEIASR